MAKEEIEEKRAYFSLTLVRWLTIESHKRERSGPGGPLLVGPAPLVNIESNQSKSHQSLFYWYAADA